MERLAADQHVGHAAGLERAHVRLRDVLAEAEEPSKEDADVPRRDVGPGASPVRSVTFQPLSLTSQSTNAPTASGSDSSIVIAETFRDAVRLRHRQRDDRRLPVDVVAERRQRT